MTLNFSRHSIFPATPSEDSVVSSIRIANSYLVEGIPEKNGDGLGRPRHINWDKPDRGDSREPVSNDILDLLPLDPFGMDISATFTAITGWLEDLEADSVCFGRDEVGAMGRDYQLFAGMNFIWNKAMWVQAEPGNTGIDKEPGNTGIDKKSNPAGRSDAWVEGKETVDGPRHCGFTSACNAEEFVSFRDEDTCVAGLLTKEFQDAIGSCSNGDGGAPHEALLFALGYLGVQDLLSAERVCRSLRSAVQSDSLLWRSIHIDKPLSERITDDGLLQLANKAQGSLQCLSLVECPRITDDGLKRVLGSNPKLTKLSVPGCMRLSVEGIVKNLKAFKSSGMHGIKQLRIGGLYGVTQDHFEELAFLLGAENHMQLKAKPRFYNSGCLYFSCDDDRAMDIEMCPRCQNLRLVYDCPAESCQEKQHATQLCRACTLCIARCVQCGRCFNDREYEETFCLDLLCLDCQKQLLKFQEKQEENSAFSSNHAIFHQGTGYHFRLCG
ncbi:hypothetical protein HHK36_015754 [Tetracentron sinense]|uniref:F-box domain-containing protein n=1 Tax=Tetracentron sinense TaxID=13715 RepID=A0A834Z2T6_TETSI|nr:hypothetical protein HHK36_015754 [Tetracentron sinense]